MLANHATVTLLVLLMMAFVTRFLTQRARLKPVLATARLTLRDVAATTARKASGT